MIPRLSLTWSASPTRSTTVPGAPFSPHAYEHTLSEGVAALLAVLKSAGIHTSNVALAGDSSPQASPAAAPTAAAAGGPNPPHTPARTVAVVAALAGLVLGAAGLMLLWARHANRERSVLRG